MDLSTPEAAKIQRIENDFAVQELDNASWQSAFQISIREYWSGEAAPAGRHCSARILWSDAALYVRFIGMQGEPLVVSDTADVSKKTIGLWDRDVCEIFIAPDTAEPNKYFEFEAAPTGEWIDVGIEITPERRLSDWEYTSGMKAAAAVEPDRVIISMKIPWTAFGKAPKAGDKWLGNLYRCVGTGPGRGYLAWQATRTAQPNFHVPSAFGEFVFVD